MMDPSSLPRLEDYCGGLLRFGELTAASLSQHAGPARPSALVGVLDLRIEMAIVRWLVGLGCDVVLLSDDCGAAQEAYHMWLGISAGSGSIVREGLMALALAARAGPPPAGCGELTILPLTADGYAASGLAGPHPNFVAAWLQTRSAWLRPGRPPNLRLNQLLGRCAIVSITAPPPLGANGMPYFQYSALGQHVWDSTWLAVPQEEEAWPPVTAIWRR